MKRTVVAAALTVALTGCGGGGEADLLSSTESICDEFAAHSKAGLPAEERTEVVESIGKAIGNADQKLKDAYGPLENTADGSDSGYRTAADGFAQACFDAGWDG